MAVHPKLIVIGTLHCELSQREKLNWMVLFLRIWHWYVYQFESYVFTSHVLHPFWEQILGEIIRNYFHQNSDCNHIFGWVLSVLFQPKVLPISYNISLWFSKSASHLCVYGFLPKCLNMCIIKGDDKNLARLSLFCTFMMTVSTLITFVFHYAMIQLGTSV